MAESRTDLIVTLSGTHPVSDVVTRLQQHGFQVHSVMSEIGVISGVAGAAEISALQALPGISDISRDHPVDIGPPGSSTTW